MKYNRGFTVIELLIVVVLLMAASMLFFIQKNNVEVAARDETRKTAINAMYYSLEEVYFKQNQSYPRTVNSEVLPSVDPDLFKDPNGEKIGEAASNFSYEATNCDGDSCKAYSLRSTLQNEDDYIKKNRN
jgi:prepilin-type N-terminal cleavage/methylation domain-containing protein